MPTPPAAERRRHVRSKQTIQLRFLHAAARREFPAQSLDISAGGMCMHVPATAPVQVGQDIQVYLPSPAADEARHVAARIVRVNRQSLLDTGNLTIGIAFAQEQTL